MISKKLKAKDIHIPIYDVTLSLYIGEYEQAKAKIKSDYGTDYDIEKCEALTCWFEDSEDDTQIIVIYFSEYANEATIAHESVHAAYYILDYVQIEIDVDNHEALAYLVGHIYQVIFDEFNRGK